MNVHISLNVKDIGESVELDQRMLGIKPLKFIDPRENENVKRAPRNSTRSTRR